MFALSALNQLSYCAHRCMLMHRCGEMAVNDHVWSGRRLHSRVDTGETSVRAGVTTWRSLRIESEVLGILGVVDCVEREGEDCRVVEYKRGRAPESGVWPNDALQVCTQAMCLEEIGWFFTGGVVFYAGSGCRRGVGLTEALRGETREACLRLGRILRGEEVPVPVPGPHCGGCSVREICLPEAWDVMSIWEER